MRKLLDKKEAEITKLKDVIKEKDAQLEEGKKIKFYFDALTARPKKDLTSFQSQIYQLLSRDKSTVEDHYKQIINIGFTELSLDNFNSILRNLERKGYIKSLKKMERFFGKSLRSNFRFNITFLNVI